MYHVIVKLRYLRNYINGESWMGEISECFRHSNQIKLLIGRKLPSYYSRLEMIVNQPLIRLEKRIVMCPVKPQIRSN